MVYTEPIRKLKVCSDEISISVRVLWISQPEAWGRDERAKTKRIVKKRSFEYSYRNKSIVVGRMQLNIFVKSGVVPKTTVKMDDLSTKRKKWNRSLRPLPKTGSKPKNSSLEYEEDCWSFTPLSGSIQISFLTVSEYIRKYKSSLQYMVHFVLRVEHLGSGFNSCLNQN